jgi:hypothetical protein
MNEQDYATVMAMQKYGGSFVQHLGILAMHADQNNLRLIKETWSLYWGQYEKMASQEK